jgi:hypothetical protein
MTWGKNGRRTMAKRITELSPIKEEKSVTSAKDVEKLGQART